MLATLMNGVTTLGPGPAVQTVMSGTATVQTNYTGNANSFYPADGWIEASLDGVNFVEVGAIGASASPQTGLINITGKWNFVRANITVLGGPAASPAGNFTVYILE